uniref:Uncharacterized protein n=1 Tax=Arundo donax TaxID=35708 RepID=A0A0A9ETK7_ARUDO
MSNRVSCITGPEQAELHLLELVHTTPTEL